MFRFSIADKATKQTVSLKHNAHTIDVTHTAGASNLFSELVQKDDRLRTFFTEGTLMSSASENTEVD